MLKVLTASAKLIGTQSIEPIPTEKSLALGEDPKVLATTAVLAICLTVSLWCFFMPFVNVVNHKNIFELIIGSFVLGFITYILVPDNRARISYDKVSFMKPAGFDQIATGGTHTGVGVTPFGIGVGRAYSNYDIQQSTVFNIEFDDGEWVVVRSTYTGLLTDLIRNLGDRFGMEKVVVKKQSPKQQSPKAKPVPKKQSKPKQAIKPIGPTLSQRNVPFVRPS